MKRKRGDGTMRPEARGYWAVGAVAVLAIALVMGCSDMAGTAREPAAPPAGTTAISVGSGGLVSLSAGTKSGEVSIFVVDQDNNPIDSAAHLTSGNIRVEVRRIGRASASTGETDDTRRLQVASNHFASNISVTYRGGSAGEPISYVLTLDRSGSMDPPDIRDMEQAALSFIGNSGPGDEGGVINFASTVVVDQDLTTNADLLRRAVQNPSPTGISTSLFDSIGEAVTLATSAANRRRAVICMTDGGENDSTTYSSARSVINHANNRSVPVHCVGLGSADEGVLNQIVSGTGGLYYRSPTSADLNDLYRQIARSLSATWSVGFTSPETFESGETYEITVTVEYPGGITDSVTVTQEA